MLSGWASRRKG